MPSRAGTRFGIEPQHRSSRPPTREASPEILQYRLGVCGRAVGGDRETTEFLIGDVEQPSRVQGTSAAAGRCRRSL